MQWVQVHPNPLGIAKACTKQKVIAYQAVIGGDTQPLIGS
ncbi:Hypothetical protein I595_1261 [Croceitalea dokdonensis DOKDO 023]|uniref:Uncharacterized protein n=1 Tax=Croceitalea dokdonensis DOKDO 023 TaxID=1300341 RepID=A0A0P7B1C9_9FLAO|nr:Hypothetical protein I595_1261 [Croceitalea dokdonensis DOKDO 023]